MTPRERAQRTAEALYQAWHKAPVEPEALIATDIIERAITDVLATDRLPNGRSQDIFGNGLKHILSSSPAVLFSFKATGDYAPTFISDNIATLLGYKPAEYLKDPDFWRRRVHPDDAARVEAEFVRLFDTGYYAQEYRFLHKDGRYRWLRDEQQLIRDQDDNPVEVVGSWSDITVRKQAEDGLIAAQERITRLVVSSPAVLYSFQAGGDYSPTFISKNIKDLFAYDPCEYMENADFWRRSVHPDDLERVESEFSRLLRVSYCALEYRFLHKDGTYRWVSDEQHLIRGKTGEPVEVVGSWSDITLRKKLEHEKDGIKARLEYLITASPAVIYSYEATGDYAPTFISDNFTELLGYEPREYLENADFWQRGVHPEDIPRVLSAMPALFEEGHISHEYRFLRKDGTYCWISDDAHLMCDDSGRPFEVVGAWSDITPRKRMGEAVVRAQNRLLHVLSSSPAVIYSFEATGDFAPTFISENIETLFGYEPDDYLKGPDFWWRRIHPDDSARVAEGFSQLLKQGRNLHEYRFLHKNGMYRWVSDEQRLISDNKGNPIEIVGSWSDVTPRKQVEEALKETEQRLSDAIEAIPQGFSLFDADDRLALCNKRYAEFLYPREGVPQAGTPFEQIIRNAVEHGLITSAKDDPDTWISSRMAAHRQPSGVLLQRRADRRWIQVSETRTHDGGTVAVYTDITDIKRAEEQLQIAKEEAERALVELKQTQASLIHSEKMASLGQLTAGIAHEIKNPLNFVNNFAGVSGELLEELKEILDPSIERLEEADHQNARELLEMLSGNLRKIKEHGARADKIVKSMLAHAREAPSTMHSTDLNALIDETLNLAYHATRAEDQTFNVTLEREFDPAIGEIDVFPQEISRVVLNLISNGFYAMHKRRTEGTAADYQPTLRITTRAIGNSVQIRVYDNGTGMSAAVLKKLFTPFFTTKPPGAGTGLGLSLSYDIVSKQHHGRFDVDSQEGEFSEFIVTLPRKATKAHTAERLN